MHLKIEENQEFISKKLEFDLRVIKVIGGDDLVFANNQDYIRLIK